MRRHRIVAHRQEVGGHAEPSGQRRCRPRQGPPLGQQPRAEEVGGQVHVTETEPRPLGAEGPQLIRGAERLAGSPPSSIAVGDAPQPVRHRVEVRRDVQPVQDDVVPGIDDDREGLGRHHPDQPTQELPGPHTSGKRHDLHACIFSGIGSPRRRGMTTGRIGLFATKGARP